MAIKVKELHHHAIQVPRASVDEVTRFYTDVLGMESDPHRPHIPTIPGAWMYVGPSGEPSTQIHIIGRDGTPEMARNAQEDPTRYHVALAVEDIDEARAELDRQGVHYWVFDNVVGNVQIFLDDPAGNMIELHQVGTCSCNRLAVKD